MVLKRDVDKKHVEPLEVQVTATVLVDVYDSDTENKVLERAESAFYDHEIHALEGLEIAEDGAEFVDDEE